MKTLIVIGGATASGKTALSLDLAKHFSTKIVSADSRQCYSELNIGVAKPTSIQLQEVQHFFINSHSIHEEVSAGSYEKYALMALQSIFNESDFAICVGGTGLYINALCKGIDEMPAVNRDIEQDMNLQYAKFGFEWLLSEIKIHDTLYFETGEIQNPSRMLRALIFKLSTKESILKFRTKKPKQRDFVVKNFEVNIPRKELYERINDRVDEMMSAGLLQEVASFIKHQHLRALQTVGYVELFGHLEGKGSLDGAIEKIKQHTRNYAKRQVTWFKNQNNFVQVTADCENIIAALKT